MNCELHEVKSGDSWTIAKRADLQKVRQRAGHSSLEVTSRYAAILNERDTSLTDTQGIFEVSSPATGLKDYARTARDSR
jgi:hypothetical protein